jgi:hydroxyacylglutathione hydrolase
MQVWPAHGAGSACGKGLGAIPSSTIGYEKMFNPAMAYDDEAEFINDLLHDQPEAPKYFAIMKHVNKVGPTVLHGLPTPAKLPAERLKELIKEEAMIIDARSSYIYSKIHTTGTINIPLSDIASWAGWFVDYEKPLYLIVDTPQLREAVRDLIYIGIDNITGYFESSVVEELGEMGEALQSYERRAASELVGQVCGDNVTLIDVRSQVEWDEGHIPCAEHLMLGHLMEQADEVINGKTVVVQCRTSNRSAVAASILKAKGAKKVIQLVGGYVDWVAADLPIKR